MKTQILSLVTVITVCLLTSAIGLPPRLTANIANADEAIIPIVQVGHVSSFIFSSDSAIAISRNRRMIVTGGGDGTIKFWDQQRYLLINSVKAHLGGVAALAFSPDGRFIASGGEDSRVRLWNAQTGKLERTFEGHKTAVNCLAFSSDSTKIASGSGSFADAGEISDNTIRIWDVQTGRSLVVLSGHQSLIQSVAFNSSGDRLASGSLDKTIRVWSVERGQALRIISTEATNSLSYSPDDKTIASAISQQILFWDANTGAQIRSISHNQYSSEIAFTPDWEQVAINGSPVEIWNIPTGQKIRTLQKTNSNTSKIAFSTDGLLVAGALSSGVVSWDAIRGGALQTFNREPVFTTSVVFNTTGDRLAWGRRKEA